MSLGPQESAPGGSEPGTGLGREDPSRAGRGFTHSTPVKSGLEGTGSTREGLRSDPESPGDVALGPRLEELRSPHPHHSPHPRPHHNPQPGGGGGPGRWKPYAVGDWSDDLGCNLSSKSWGFNGRQGVSVGRIGTEVSTS